MHIWIKGKDGWYMAAWQDFSDNRCERRWKHLGYEVILSPAREIQHLPLGLA